MRQWLNESREDIHQERILARTTAEWETHAQDTSYLLTGSRLEQVETWYATTELNLTSTEQIFITASLQERDKRQKVEAERIELEAKLEQRAMNRLRALLGVFATATVVALVLLGLLFNAFNDVEAERNNAQRINLAAQGQIVLQNGQPAELAALLALNSLELGYSPEADAVLQASLQHGFALREYVGHSDVIRNLHISTDGLQMVSFSEDHTARVWDIYSGEELLSVNHGSLLTTGRLSNDSRLIATAGTEGNIIIWDATNGMKIHTLSHGNGFVWVGYFSPDSQYITSANNSAIVNMWDVETGKLVRTFESPGGQFGIVLFTPDGRYILGAGNQLVLWDVETGEIVRRFFGHTDFIIHADVSPDGRRFITGSRDRTARLWDIATGQEIWQFDGHTDTVGTVDFSPNGNYVITGSDDGTVRIWNISTGEELQRFELSGVAYGARYLADGNHIVTAGSDRTIRLWHLDALAEPLIFAEEFNSSKRGELNLGAELVANDNLLTFGANGGVRFWNRVGDVYTIDSEMTYGDQVVDVLVYHAQSHQVATASNTGVIQIWDSETAELNVSLVGHNGSTIYNLAFSADGQWIVSAGSDGVAYVWNARTGEQLLILGEQDDGIQVARFSPDGRIVATAGNDFTIYLWDTATGSQLARLEGHTSVIRDLDFSPDGRYLVSVSHDTLWIVPVLVEDF